MFEKQAMLAKKVIGFVINCPFIFREKSMQKRAERLSAQKSTKKHVWNLIFQRKVNS